MKTPLFAALILFVFLCGASAGEDADHTFRILGLFQPDRVDDLQAVVETLPGVTLSRVNYEAGEATFRFDAQAVYGGAAQDPQKLAEAFDRTLREASKSTFEIGPHSEIARDKLTEVQIGILGLDCKGCSYGVYRVVYKLEGVQRATASFGEGVLRAWIDPQQTSRELLEAELVKKGVKVANTLDESE